MKKRLRKKLYKKRYCGKIVKVFGDHEYLIKISKEFRFHQGKEK